MARLSSLLLVASCGLAAASHTCLLNRRLVVFGDSLSASPPGLVYNPGTGPTNRLTNGMVWHEYLQTNYSVDVVSYAQADARAIGAPGSGRANLAGQVAEYLGSNVPNATDCFAFWIGANDMINNVSVVAGDIVAAVQASVGTLVSRGAKCIMAFNMPTVARFPFYASLTQTSPGNATRITNGVLAANQAIANVVSQANLNSNGNVAYILVNTETAFSMAESLTWSPSTALNPSICVISGVRDSTPTCIDAASQLPYFWVDGSHPVTLAHYALLQSFLEDMCANLQPAADALFSMYTFQGPIPTDFPQRFCVALRDSPRPLLAGWGGCNPRTVETVQTVEGTTVLEVLVPLGSGLQFQQELQGALDDGSLRQAVAVRGGGVIVDGVTAIIDFKTTQFVNADITNRLDVERPPYVLFAPQYLLNLTSRLQGGSGMFRNGTISVTFPVGFQVTPDVSKVQLVFNCSGSCPGWREGVTVLGSAGGVFSSGRTLTVDFRQAAPLPSAVGGGDILTLRISEGVAQVPGSCANSAGWLYIVRTEYQSQVYDIFMGSPGTSMCTNSCEACRTLAMTTADPLWICKVYNPEHGWLRYVRPSTADICS